MKSVVLSELKKKQLHQLAVAQQQVPVQQQQAVE
jgi:hypothetical protein